MVMQFSEISDDEVQIRIAPDATAQVIGKGSDPVTPTEEHMPLLESDSPREHLTEPPSATQSVGPAPTSPKGASVDHTTTSAPAEVTDELSDTRPIRKELAAITLHAGPEAENFE